jgi:hypothetical protein
MKKTILIGAIALICLPFSCDKGKTCKHHACEADGFSSLKEQLLSLNESIPQKTIEPTKAKWWSYLLTGLADVGGFFGAGGAGLEKGKASPISAAVGASTLIWNLTKDAGYASSNSDPAYSIINDAQIALSQVDGEGYIHNKAILDLYEENGDSLFFFSIEKLLPLIYEKVAIESRSSEGTYATSKEDTRIVNDVLSAYSSSTTIDEYFEKLKTISPGNDEVLDVLSIIMAGFDSIDAVANDGVYYNEVRKIVSHSAVSEETKEIIISSLSIANASSRLWKEN